MMLKYLNFMQVKATYIVKTDSGTLTLLYETFDKQFFINTHIVGQVRAVGVSEVAKLLKQ